MIKTTVGVLRGGPSEEYDISLKTGANVIGALDENKYNVFDILIDKSGVWYLRGMPVDPSRALRTVDVVFNALHGKYGEDGVVQRVLDSMRIPYTGPRPDAAAFAMNKSRARKILSKLKIKMPKAIGFDVNNDSDMNAVEMAKIVFMQFGPPYIVKPVLGGSSMGVVLANTFNDLPDVLAEVLNNYGKALVEEYIPGKEATVGVVENYRGEELYALPALEIAIKDMLFDEHSKYASGDDIVEKICPSTFDESVKNELERVACEAHKALGLRHYSRSDFRIRPNGNIYFLETNSLPGLTTESLLPCALGAVGASLPEFVDHCINCVRR